MNKVIFCILIINLSIISLAYAQKDKIYWTDNKSGTPLLTNVGKRSNSFTISAKKVNTHLYNKAINNAAKKYNLDSELLKAVISTESNFDRYAVSPKGAKGLMQLMPATAKAMGVKDVFDVNQNIDGGAKYLRYLLDLYDENLELALAAYNAGPQAVEKYNGVPPYKETKNYIRIINRKYKSNNFYFVTPSKITSYFIDAKPIKQKIDKNGKVIFTNIPGMWNIGLNPICEPIKTRN